MNKIKEIRKNREMTLQSLADKVGTSKSQIDKLERSERRLTVDWMIRIAEALNVPPANLLPEHAQSKPAESIKRNSHLSGFLTPLGGAMSTPTPTTAQQPALPPDVPVMGTAMGGSNAFLFNNGETLEYVRRPANLVGVNNAFAVYAIGDSMEPRFFAGEVLFINPNRPITANAFIVLELMDGQGLIKQFKKRTEDAVTLHQYNPDKDLTIKHSEIRHMYRIVSSSESN